MVTARGCVSNTHSARRTVWHNWIIRDAETNEDAGFVQATVVGSSADVAQAIGLHPTDVFDDDGERLWRSS